MRAGKLSDHVHRGHRLAGAGRPVEQQAASKVAARGAQSVDVTGERDRVGLDPLEHTRRQDDPLRVRSLGSSWKRTLNGPKLTCSSEITRPR